MNRDKANLIFEAYGKLKLKAGNVNISFSRQTEDDIEGIESKTDDELIHSWKDLVYLNEIAGHVSLNDLQRVALIELEFDERESVNQDDLRKWYKEETDKYEAN